MQLSPQAVETRPVPSSQPPERGWPHRRVDRLIKDWGTTPGKLRLIRIVLVIGIVLAGVVGVVTANNRVNTTRDIAERLEPLNADVTTLYESLADADATVAAGFLSGGVESSEVRVRYDQDILIGTASLAQAGTQADEEPVTAQRIADITGQLPVYTGLVERARANNRQGVAVGVTYLRNASERMREVILPAAAELQRRQASRLNDAYQRAGAVPVVALAACGASLAGLTWVQVFLCRRTQRVLNVGLVLATGAVLTGLAWWTAAGMASASSLARALGHSRSVSEALGPAQLTALQARAVESLGLITRDGASEPDFDARMQILARNDGAGGALGAAMQFATDPKGRAMVQAAVDAAGGYDAAHKEVRRLDDVGEYPQAVDAAVGTHPASAAVAFDRLTAVLQNAVDHEREAFGRNIDRARDWLTGLPTGIGTLALIAAVGVALGVRQRLEEYR
ncbi:MAG TPA: hypothetical protein VE645_04365 [Pseudonocardiaceae bacterium]|nr:hypothetical protein [Pseudonocardiaceae bacterium]